MNMTAMAGYASSYLCLLSWGIWALWKMRRDLLDVGL